MKDSEPILRLENVHKAFGETVVLDGVDLEIYAGQTTVIIGPSGCGKSVLLKHMIGLIHPDSGRVYFRNHEISSLSEKRLVPIRRRMGFLFQSSGLFDSITVHQSGGQAFLDLHVQRKVLLLEGIGHGARGGLDNIGQVVRFPAVRLLSPLDS